MATSEAVHALEATYLLTYLLTYLRVATAEAVLALETTVDKPSLPLPLSFLRLLLLGTPE